MNGRLNSKSFHQPFEFLHGERSGFIRVSRPLVNTFGQPFGDHTVTVAVKADALDTVPLCSAEQKKRLLLQRVKIIFEANDCHQAADPFSEIGFATAYYDPLETCTAPKHSGQLSEQQQECVPEHSP